MNKYVPEHKLSEDISAKCLGSYFNGNLRTTAGTMQMSEIMRGDYSAKTARYLEGRKICYATLPNGQISRRLAQEICYNNYIKHLIPGDVISGVVTNAGQVATFVDIGCGFTAILPNKDVAVSITSSTAVRRFTAGQEIQAVVKTNDEKVSLTHKELLGTSAC